MCFCDIKFGIAIYCLFYSYFILECSFNKLIYLTLINLNLFTFIIYNWALIVPLKKLNVKFDVDWCKKCKTKKQFLVNTLMLDTRSALILAINFLRIHLVLFFVAIKILIIKWKLIELLISLNSLPANKEACIA